MRFGEAEGSSAEEDETLPRMPIHRDVEVVVAD
jgi:hypothetical protein